MGPECPSIVDIVADIPNSMLLETQPTETGKMCPISEVIGPSQRVVSAVSSLPESPETQSNVPPPPISTKSVSHISIQSSESEEIMVTQQRPKKKAPSTAALLTSSADEKSASEYDPAQDEEQLEIISQSPAPKKRKLLKKSKPTKK